MVQFIKEIHNEMELLDYLAWSGFKNIEEWYSKAKKSKFLYRVGFVVG